MCQEKLIFKMTSSGGSRLNYLLNAGVSKVAIKSGVPRNIGHETRESDRCKVLLFACYAWLPSKDGDGQWE
jgi:hypothetical protein